MEPTRSLPVKEFSNLSKGIKKPYTIYTTKSTSEKFRRMVEKHLRKGNKPTEHSESCKGKSEAYLGTKSKHFFCKQNVVSFLQSEEARQNNLKNCSLK